MFDSLPLACDNNYIVYNDGKIYSNKSSLFLKPVNNGNGYFFVNIWSNGKPKIKYIHRVVAETFLENSNNHRYVDHIDRDKTNNHLSNLRWVSASENTQNTAGKPRYSVERTCQHFLAELKNKIKLDYIGGLKVMEISNKYNVPRQSVSRFVKNIREERGNLENN